MPATFVHRLILTLGLLSLFHAAYSAAQRKYFLSRRCLRHPNQGYVLVNTSIIIWIIAFRSVVFEIKRAGVHTFTLWCKYLFIIAKYVLFKYWHFQVIIQALVSLFVVMYGVMFVAGDFKEIKASADLEKKSWETFANVPSFYMFNHRGKAFSHNYVPTNTKSNLDQVN